ncbi:MAG: ABC transporter ATP-binding protein, partial [Chloroflexota bacterium]
RMTLLSVEGLSVGYASPRGIVRAVDGVSLVVHGPGEAVGIIGESGSGKSSLALALMRTLPHNATQSAGRIEFQGRDIMALGDEEFRRTVRWSGISMVTQGAQHALNPVITVGDQVAERLRSDGMGLGDARALVDGLLGRMGLPAGTSRRYPHELSGGMRQRVMIAMALTHDPPLVILDEPTSALDVSVQAQIMNLLKELKWERGISMLFITHDLALASDLCDRIMVVYAGQVREDGPADSVLALPRDPYTQGLLASLPSLHDDVPPRPLAGSPPDPVAPPLGCRFARALPGRVRGGARSRRR